MIRSSIFFQLIIISICSQAQTDSVSMTLPKVSFSGFSEIYYTWDFGKPDNHNRPDFIYSHNRHNEITLNLGFAKVAYESERARANFALMAGTYSNANLSAEPGVLKNIYEANAGIKISQNKNLWVDAGIFSSHIGFESAHSPSCWTLTRSIPAENSPYYESGAKMTFISRNGKWLLSGLVLNGWQRMQRVNGNQAPAFGTQISYTPGEKITLNSSSFIGNDKPDTVKQMRYFHDFYGIFRLHPKLSAILGFDMGAEQKGKGSVAYNIWYSPIVIFKIHATEKFSIGLRGEYYSDENGVIISTGTPNGFQTMGYSLNMDYSISENVLWRLEGRGFNSKDKIFFSDSWLSDENYFVTTSLAVTF